MAEIENFKQENSKSRKKAFFTSMYNFFMTECRHGKPFYLSIHDNTTMKEHTFPEDVTDMIRSIYDINLDDDLSFQKPLKLVLELAIIYINVDEAECNKHQWNPCYSCVEVIGRIRKYLIILLNGNDQSIFKFKIKINKSENNYGMPEILLEPVEFSKLINNINENKNIKKGIKKIINSYLRIGINPDEKSAIAAKLGTQVIEDPKFIEIKLKNQKGHPIKIVDFLGNILNNYVLRHSIHKNEQNADSPNLEAIADFVFYQCLTFLQLKDNWILTNDNIKEKSK